MKKDESFEIDVDESVQQPKRDEWLLHGPAAEVIYRKNLDALRETHPELEELIESTVINEDRVRILGSESGNPRICYQTDDGKEIYIHSSDDPEVCAIQAIELLGKIEKEGIIVLFGFGLGYFAEEVFRRFEKGHVLAIYEASPQIFKAAIMIKDFSGLFSSDKVKIILGADADNYQIVHSHHHLLSSGKFWVVKHKPSVEVNPDAYDRFFKRLDEERRISNLGVATLVSRGKEFIDAFLANVPSVVRSAGVKELKDIFKGRPAIVVSTGPSLDRNLHLLKKAKGKAVIIATGGALPTLLSCGIIPDMAVEIDPVSLNIEEKFMDIPLLKSVPLICLAQYTPGLVDIYPGPLLINGVPQNIAYSWLSNYFDDKGYIECFGGSVAHLAFATAEFIGATVIAFVGQDLSYSGRRVHTEGYSDSLDHMLEEGLKKETGNIPGAIPVKDIFGEEVSAIEQFLNFKVSFESRIRLFEGTVVNATEAGLAIEGAVNMRLQDFITEYCHNLDEADTFSLMDELSGKEAQCNFDGVFAQITAARDKFEEIKKTSKQILKHIKRVKILKNRKEKDSPELHSILSKIEKLIETVSHPSINLLAAYHYGLELYLKKQEVQEIDDIEDRWEMLDKQLQRGEIYYGQIVHAIDLFNKQLKSTLASLKMERKIDTILSKAALSPGERSYKAGMLYEKAGKIARAVKCFEAAMREPETRDLVVADLAGVYLKQYRFYEARELLKTGAGDELLKTCDEKIGAWEQRKEKMAKLLKDAEANYGGDLESGYFYFRIKDYERAGEAYLKAIAGGKEAVAGSQDISAAYYGLAHVYLAKNEVEKAVEELEKAIEADPTNPIFYRDLGFIAYQNDNTESAERFFTRAIELAPRSVELYKLLSDFYVGRSEVEKAISLYEDALLANPDNPFIQKELAALYQIVISRKSGTA